MQLELTREQMEQRGGLLDQIMEVAFDAAVLVDRYGIILHRSTGSLRLTQSSIEESLGKSIGVLDPQSPFEKVLENGKAVMGLMVVINQRKCMTNIIPIFCGGQIIGAMGTVLFRDISKLKKVLSAMNDQVEETKTEKNIYDIISRVDSNYTFDDFIGESPAVKEMLEYCKRAANTLHPILITGETGTGKEIIANAFHSATMGHLYTPFVKINCSAIPKELLESELFGYAKGAFTGAMTEKKGKFELASGGAILLDEIGEMELSLQSKLLRVIEEQEFEKVGGNTLMPLNARIIASTNQNLLSQVEEGLFRRDLYYRLNTIEISLPPLRERAGDIPLLVSHFLRMNGLEISFEPQAMELFKSYDWPGNVRELKHVIERLTFAQRQGAVTPQEARQLLKIENHPQKNKGFASPASMEEHERNLVTDALGENLGNVSAAARQLGISRATLYSKINKFGLDVVREVRNRG